MTGKALIERCTDEAGAVLWQGPYIFTRALGMGGNFTALARGFAVGAWNPALLGMSDNPGFSIAIAPVTARAGPFASISYVSRQKGRPDRRGERLTGTSYA